MESKRLKIQKPVLIQLCTIVFPHFKSSFIGEVSHLEYRIYLVSFRKGCRDRVSMCRYGVYPVILVDLESRNKSNQTNCLTVPWPTHISSILSSKARRGSPSEVTAFNEVFADGPWIEDLWRIPLGERRPSMMSSLSSLGYSETWQYLCLHGSTSLPRPFHCDLRILDLRVF